MFDAKAFLSHVSTRSGVYCFLNKDKRILYVGKAKNLKQRLRYYFHLTSATSKTNAMMAHVCDIQVTVTSSEVEALLLESNLIKKHAPRYNVVLRDDKRYPYLMISHDDFPRMDLYRGLRHRGADFFGPFPSVSDVREMLRFIQRAFKLRQCSQLFFSQRKRPCLQYQISRCSAPCVAKISREDYAQSVMRVKQLLQGQSEEVLEALACAMAAAAEDQAYEQAAEYRDQISMIRAIQAKQCASLAKGDVDVFALSESGGVCAIAVLVIRGGEIIASQTFLPQLPALEEFTASLTLTSFISQYYFAEQRLINWPKTLVLSHDLSEGSCLLEAIQSHAKREVNVQCRVRQAKAAWLAMAKQNADYCVQTACQSKQSTTMRLEALQRLLDLPQCPQHLECFDVSHTQGQATMASCVVFVDGVADKSAYRRFEIKGISPGDDYAAMHQVLTRRYQKQKDQHQALPDVVIVDGGKGQLKQAVEVFETLGIQGVVLLAVAKGPSRKAGLEQLFVPKRTRPLTVGPSAPALLLIQSIRDEAHRFAIVGHRVRRQKTSLGSGLESIPGVGAARRRALLKHFGGLQALKKASVVDIAKVPGISDALARLIDECLHTG